MRRPSTFRMFTPVHHGTYSNIIYRRQSKTAKTPRSKNALKHSARGSTSRPATSVDMPTDQTQAQLIHSIINTPLSFPEKHVSSKTLLVLRSLELGGNQCDETALVQLQNRLKRLHLSIPIQKTERPKHSKEPKLTRPSTAIDANKRQALPLPEVCEQPHIQPLSPKYTAKTHLPPVKVTSN